MPKRRILTEICWFFGTAIVMWFILNKIGFIDDLRLYICIIIIVAVMKILDIICNQKKN